jgi:hypothetical protein
MGFYNHFGREGNYFCRLRTSSFLLTVTARLGEDGINFDGERSRGSAGILSSTTLSYWLE